MLRFLVNLHKIMQQILQVSIWKRQRNGKPKGQGFYDPTLYTDYVLDVQDINKNWTRFSFSSYDILMRSLITSFELIGTDKI